MIELRQVTREFGDVRAVDNVSFTVNKGEIFGLIGTSGCGKTTTLKMINRLVEPTSGAVLVKGESVKDRPPEELRRNIGYVIQDVGLFPHYSIRENISVVPRLLNWNRKKAEDRCEELLNFVGLDPSRYSDRRPDALSGGQKQRVGFARALAADPELILMDEPFGALDPITKDRIQQEFKELLGQIKKTIVLVTHDVSEAFDLCDRVALMNNGKIHQIGPPRDLLLKPADDFVFGFFERNRLELEMQTITIRDIINIGEVRSDAGGEESVTVELEESVAGVLNRKEIESGSVNFVLAEDEGGRRVGYLEVDSLFTSFSEVRKKLKAEDYG